MPFVRCERLFGLDADGIVKPALDEMDVKLSALLAQAVPVGAVGVDHARHDRAAALAFSIDPCGNRKLVEKPKIADIAGVNELVSIKNLRERSRRIWMRRHDDDIGPSWGH